MSRRVLIALATVAAFACRSHPPPGATQSVASASGARSVGWRKLGSWSGHGNLQTTSFETVTGQLRIRWRTAAGESGQGGSFKVTASSAISGRPLQVAVDRTGPGEGVAYVSQDPHDLYMLVESADLDWSFTVEEAVSGTIQGVPSPSGQ